MSKYTTEVRFICEAESGLTESAGFNSVESIIAEAAPKVFNFPFPIWDENYKLALETKILRHYYTREICEETVGLWKLRLADKLNLIMPYYNKLYETTVLEFNPLYDVDYTRTHEGESTGSSVDTATNNETIQDTGNGTRSVEQEQENDLVRTINTDTERTLHTEGNDSESASDEKTHGADKAHWDLYNDTPQGGIEGVQGTPVPGVANASSEVATNELLLYLTNARKVTDHEQATDRTVFSVKAGENERDDTENTGTDTTQNDTNTTTITNEETTTNSNLRTGQSTRRGTSDIENTDQYVEHVVGKMGTRTYARVIMELRESLINIDAMIVEELSDCFIRLW